MYNNAKQKAD